MRINTRTGSLDLTKRELQTLADCKALLFAISKHGTGDLEGAADEAAECIGAVQAALSGKEIVLTPSGEIANAPY